MAFEIFDIIFIVFAFITIYIMMFFMILYKERNKLGSKIDRDKSITFLIPVYNGENTIQKTIRSVKNLNYPKDKIEIIVLDDGSEDKTSYLSKQENVKVINLPHKGKAEALNKGIEIAKHDFIATVDDDSILDENSIQNAMGYFNEDNVYMVTGTILAKKGKNLLARFQELEYILIAWARKNIEHIESIYVTPGPLSVYKKNIFKKIGNFDKNILTEDIEIAFRALDNGYKIRMSPNSVSYTALPEKFSEWVRQRNRWNIGGFQTIFKYRKNLIKRIGILGNIILPFFISFYLVGILNLIFFGYFIYRFVYSSILSYFQYSSAGLNFFNNLPPLEIPAMVLYISLLILAFSVFYSIKNFNFYNRKFNKKDFIVFALYLIMYIPIFPFLLIYSMIKMILGKREW